MGIITQGKRLLDAFLTRSQRQLLGIFFGHPDQSFYLNQVVRMAGVGTGAVQRELKRLSEAGILLVERVGNQKHYRANAGIPIYEELCGIARKTFGVVDALRAALERLPFGPDLVIAWAEQQESASTIRLLVVSDRLDSGMLNEVLAPLRLGRNITPWLLDRRRFKDLWTRSDRRLQQVLEGPKVTVMGTVDAVLEN